MKVQVGPSVVAPFTTRCVISSCGEIYVVADLDDLGVRRNVAASSGVFDALTDFVSAVRRYPLPCCRGE